MRMFARLYKVDEARREVWGRLAEEIPDSAKEVFDYASSKPHFEAWTAEFQKNTGGKSYGNLRAMHNLVAAGKLIAINFDDVEKAIDIGTKVVDDNEWEKVEEGVYTGFSVGGKYLKKWSDGKNMRYTGKPNEVSLVDKPCIPTATFYEVIKMDGSVVKAEFKTPMSNEQAVDELAKMLNAGTISAVDLVGLAKSHMDDEEEGEDDADAQDDEAPEGIDQEEWDDMDEEEREDWLDEHGKAAKAAKAAKADDGKDGEDKKDGKDAKDAEDDDDEGKDGEDEQEDEEEDKKKAAKADGGATDSKDTAAHNQRIELKARELAKAAFDKLPEKDRAAMKGLEEADWQNYVSVAIRDLAKIAERKDADPKEGESKYGDVKFADEKNKKYPIDTEAHIRAAWNYINKPKNAGKYSAEDAASIKAKIVAAWKSKIDKEGPPSAQKADGADKEEKCNMADNKGDLKKGLSNVSAFCNVLYSCASILSSAQYDATMEGDNSPIPDELRGWIAQGAEIFKGMAQEEADELVETCHTAAYGGSMTLADLASTDKLAKAVVEHKIDVAAIAKSNPPDLIKAIKDAVLLKYGARHSKEDLEHLQQAHDHLTKLGAMCKSDTVKGPDEMNQDHGNKHVSTEVIDKADGDGTLLKALTEVDTLRKANTDLEERVKKLEAQPMPAKGVLRVVGKGEDNDNGVQKADAKPAIESTPGKHNPVAAEALIKAEVENKAGLRKAY